MGRTKGQKKPINYEALKKSLADGWSLPLSVSKAGIRYDTIYKLMEADSEFRDIVMSFYKTYENRKHTRYDFYLWKFYENDESRIK